MCDIAEEIAEHLYYLKEREWPLDMIIGEPQAVNLLRDAINNDDIASFIDALCMDCPTAWAIAAHQYIRRGDYETVQQYCEPAAERGCIYALYSLGLMHMCMGLKFNTYEIKVEHEVLDAIALYKKAVQLGCILSHFNLGICYRALRNYTEMKYWYEMGGQAGCSSSLNVLGCYYETQGDYTNALKYWNMAAQMGDDFGASNLSRYNDSTTEPISTIMSNLHTNKWSLRAVCRRPDFNLQHALSNPDYNWDWKYLSGKTALIGDDVVNLSDKDWDWGKLSFTLSVDTALVLKDKPWDWATLTYRAPPRVVFEHPDVAWDWSRVSIMPGLKMDNVLTLVDKPWNWKVLSANNTLTVAHILAFPHVNWDWSLVSSNPNLDISTALQHPELPWDWSRLSSHVMLKRSHVVDYPDLPWVTSKFRFERNDM